MTKSIKVQGKTFQFSKRCVVCQQPSIAEYRIDKSFYYGNRTLTVSLPVPMCETHHSLAVGKNKNEQTIGRGGMILGAILGVAAGAGLFVYWLADPNANILVNVLLAAFLAVAVFMVVWMAALFWLAPLSADPEVKKVRQAVQITDIRPASGVMTVQFANDQAGDDFSQANASQLV